MKIIHSSDWHLGHTLYGQKRYKEFEDFLQWLLETIQQESVDVLLIAGDIFDSTTPNNQAMELYYRFLKQVTHAGCRHVVIIGGNHDSHSLLNAPKEILKLLNVHVVGSATENPEDEVVILYDSQNQAELIVCAVPYLRDRDVRKTEAGENITDKNTKLLAGIQLHYQKVCEFAEKQRKLLNSEIPLVAMGHLFTAGGETIEGGGVRDLYVGSLAHVESSMFPQCIDYLALGHLHVPQRVAGSDFKRYSGSPLPMSFGECKQQKQIVVLEYSQETKSKSGLSIQEIPVPCFQKLESIRGDLDFIVTRLQQLTQEEGSAWLEIIYEGNSIIGDLQETLKEQIEQSSDTILRIKNKGVFENALRQMVHQESLEDLSEVEVFQRCLTLNKTPDSQKEELLLRFHEIRNLLHEEGI